MTARARPPLRIGLIGFGRIGRRIAEKLRASAIHTELRILARGNSAKAAEALLGEEFVEAELGGFLSHACDIVVECASAAMLAEAGPAILASGADLMPLSLAAFADPATERRLLEAADRGPGRIELCPGAAGTLGFLAAAKQDGLKNVTWHQAYPPSIWRKTAAAHMIDLDSVTTRAVFFRGNARQAATLFPRNLNAALGVALAGIGLDATGVELAVDPAIPHANYAIAFQAGPGPVRIEIGHRGTPEGSDPADYTAFSVLRLIKRRTARIMI